MLRYWYYKCRSKLKVYYQYYHVTIDVFVMKALSPWDGVEFTFHYIAFIRVRLQAMLQYIHHTLL